MSDVTVLIDPDATSLATLATRLKSVPGVTLRFADGPIIDLDVAEAAMASVRSMVEEAGGSIHGVAKPVLMEPIDPWTVLDSSARS